MTSDRRQSDNILSEWGLLFLLLSLSLLITLSIFSIPWSPWLIQIFLCHIMYVYFIHGNCQKYVKIFEISSVNNVHYIIKYMIQVTCIREKSTNHTFKAVFPSAILNSANHSVSWNPKKSFQKAQEIDMSVFRTLGLRYMYM